VTAAWREQAIDPGGESPDCRLYLVTPARLDPIPFGEALKAALDAGDVACVQLRLKEADDDAVRAAADALRPLCHAREVAFLINDRPDLAAQTGSDGVHVGQQDAACKTARQLIGEDAIVGVTCHNSRDLAMAAGEEGADYVAFGAFYPTTTKEAKTQADPGLLAWWTEVTVLPCVAIGGITVANCGPLVTAGADFIAVISAVWNHAEGSAAAVAAFNSTIARALEERR